MSASLLGCAYAAARARDRAHTHPLHPYRGPLAQHIGKAERFGVVTATVLGGAAWMVGRSGHFGVSMLSSEMGGMRAELSGSVLWTALFGLLVGALAGFAGSLLSVRRGDRVPGVQPQPDRQQARGMRAEIGDRAARPSLRRS